MADLVLNIGSFSDGDATKQPPTGYNTSSSNVYEHKLGALWAKARAENGDSTSEYMPLTPHHCSPHYCHFKYFKPASLLLPHRPLYII